MNQVLFQETRWVQAARQAILHLILFAGGCRNPLYAPSVTVAASAVTFSVGSEFGDLNERPVHSVTVSGFDMERYEVTVSAYRACVDAGVCSPPSPDDVRMQGLDPAACNFERSDREEHPINCVTWKQADDYCRWKNYRLPSEPEWELAARGTAGSRYPWGNDAPATQACWGRTIAAGTCPADSFPRTLGGLLDADGLSDLAGNVWEWTSSVFCSYDSGACLTTFVVRGGSWDYFDAGVLRSSYRLAVPSTFASSAIGFRCARSSS